MTKLLTKVIKGAFLIMIALTLHSCNDPDPLPGPLWERSSQSYDSRLFVNRVVFTDNQTVWASGIAIPDMVPVPDLPVHIFRSTDGGKSWTDNIIPETNKLGALVFPFDKNLAWVKVRGKGIFKTLNGGANWSLINSEKYFTDPFISNSFDFSSATEGLAIVYYDPDGTQNDTVGMLRTHDGGTSWSPANLYGSIPRQSGEMFTTYTSQGNYIALFSNKGRLLLSSDRGNTWRASSCAAATNELPLLMAINSSQKIAISSIASANNGNPYFYTNTKVFFSGDGGVSWNTSTIDQQMAWLYPVPGRDNINIATAYQLYTLPRGTYLSVDNCLTFESIDNLKENIGTAAFYSIDKGIGASFNYNKDPSFPNYFYQWNPESIMEKIR
jgi:photosystem II stability/assembly factor-like uncharacterized protein